MNPFENVLANEYAQSADGWKVEHITAVRDSCLKYNGTRLRLERMLIGDVALFGILMIARVATDGYQIYRRTYTFEVALGIIENRLDPSKPKPRARKPKPPKAKPVEILPIETLPLFSFMKAS